MGLKECILLLTIPFNPRNGFKQLKTGTSPWTNALLSFSIIIIAHGVIYFIKSRIDVGFDLETYLFVFILLFLFKMIIMALILVVVFDGIYNKPVTLRCCLMIMGFSTLPLLFSPLIGLFDVSYAQLIRMITGIYFSFIIAAGLDVFYKLPKVQSIFIIYIAFLTTNFLTAFFIGF